MCTDPGANKLLSIQKMFSVYKKRASHDEARLRNEDQNYAEALQLR